MFLTQERGLNFVKLIDFFFVSLLSLITYAWESVGEGAEKEKMEKILQAGLLVPLWHVICSWEFIVVQDKAVLAKMANARTSGARRLDHADCRGRRRQAS